MLHRLMPTLCGSGCLRSPVTVRRERRCDYVHTSGLLREHSPLQKPRSPRESFQQNTSLNSGSRPRQTTALLINPHTMRLKRELKALGIIIPDKPAPLASPTTQGVDEDVRNHASHEAGTAGTEVAEARPHAQPALQSDPTIQGVDEDVQNDTPHDAAIVETEVAEAQLRPNEGPRRPATSAINTVPKIDTVLLSDSVPTQMRECIVCGEAYPTHFFPNLEGCAQAPNMCRNCFSRWLREQVGSTVLLSDIKCPCEDQGCKVSFTHADVQQYATPDVFKR